MPEPLKLVGRYEVLEVLGRGGMAKVYVARQVDLERFVALKELGAFHADDETTARRFLRESRVAGGLSHPNIVTVFDYFEHDGTPYIAMELVPGGSLRGWIGRMTVAQVAGVLEGVLAGLAHAQAEGIVHRDLKPENLLVTSDGRVKIADFGIARASSAVQTSNLTATGSTVGTPTYMAPEQAMAGEIGPWTDLYAVGVIAYELATARVPFAGGEPMSVLLRHVNERPVPASTVAPGVEPALSDWIDGMLAKQPEGRPGSAAEAWEALEEIVEDMLGPRWRRGARLTLPAEGADTPRPLTPAQFSPPVEAPQESGYVTSPWGEHTAPAAAPPQPTTAPSLPAAPGPATSAAAAPPEQPTAAPSAPAPPAAAAPAGSPPAAAPPPEQPTAAPLSSPGPQARPPSPARRPRRRVLFATAAGLAVAAAFAAALVLSSDGDDEAPRVLAPPGSAPVPLPDRWARGVQLVSYGPDGYASDRTRRLLEAATVKGTTHVSLHPVWAVDDLTGNEVDPAPEFEPTDEAVETAARHAREAGLEVIVHPVGIILSDVEDEWVGDLEPSDHDAFFASYGEMIRAEADFAQRVGADILVIGANLNHLVGDTEAWETLIGEIRSRFDGRLTYGADTTDGLGDVGFWGSLDLIGIDGATEIDEDATPPPAEIAARWKDVIAGVQSVHEAAGKPAIFTSLGYPNRTDALRRHSAEGERDDAAQARAIEGAFRAWARVPWLEGIVWQQLSAEGQDAKRDEPGFWILGRPAETVVGAWHTARG